MSLIKTYNAPEIKLSPLATDHSGTKMGKLTIMHPTRSEGTHLIWAAECACGTMVGVRASQIVIGTVDSCGKCQKLPYVTLPELPYTLEDDKEEPPVQIDLDLEEIEEHVIEDVVSGRSREEDKFGAWDAAIRCCKILDALSDEECTKARQLMDVHFEDYL